MSNKSDNTCVVCFKNVIIYSVGCCDHVVCFECSTRMRVLCRQNECPICRQDMQLVVFTKDIAPFSELKTCTRLLDKKYNIAFVGHDVQDAFYKLLEHRCALCGNKTFRRFQDLSEHMKKVHDLFYCDLCVNNLKILGSERRCYNKSELAQHRKKGDADDKSHRGHPLCEFCDTRFMDNDDLYRHLRREHLFCHFCDADGLDMYYSSYNYLREHFRQEHYLCEEGLCVEEKFTPVFRTEIDLRAHRANEHGKSLGKVATKQARTLEVEFTLKPRPRNHPDNRRRPIDVGVEEREEDLDYGKPELAPQLTASDFPSLGNASASDVAPPRAYKGLKSLTYRNQGPQYEENFPGLPGGAATAPSTSVSFNFKPNQKQNNVSITVNHRTGNNKSSHKPSQEAFPALSSQPTPSSKSSLNWVSVSKTTKKTPAPAPLPAQPQPPRDEDFPTLSTKIANLNVSKPPLKTNFVSLTESSKKKKASSVTIPMEKSWPAVVTESPQKNAKTKKKKKTEDNVKKKDEDVSETSALNNTRPLPTAADWFGTPKIPPGFEAYNGHPSVPPGFESQSNGLTAFTNSSGEMFPIHATAAPYLPPADFSERNAQALAKVNEILLDPARVDGFRNNMAQFRDGHLSAKLFVQHCLNTMGEAGVSDTLPELIVLLPDIGKQLMLFDELERLGIARTGKKKLESCRVCRQVVTTADMKHHLTNHVLRYNS